MELSLRHVEILCAVEDAGSINGAAARLGVPQPSLSAQLQRIERELGEAVFERRTSGVIVTAPGRRVLSHARAAQAAMTRLRGQAHGSAGDRPVRIGGIGPLLMALLDRLADADEDRPVLPRDERSSRLLQTELERGKLDYVFLREYAGLEIDAGVGVREWELIADEPVFVAVGGGHRLAREAELDLADLRDESWALDPDDDSGAVAHFRRACAQVGFQPRVGLVSSDNEVTRGYVDSGRGIALAEARVRSRPGLDDLVVRPLAGDPVRCRIVLRWREEAEELLPSGAVVAALSAAYAEAVRAQPVYREWRERRSRQAR